MEREEKEEKETKIQEEVKEEEHKKSKKERKQKKPLVTCRILFISVLDKIMFIALILGFVGMTWANFHGHLSSPNYGYWRRVISEIGILIGTVIEYLILNWFYRCAAKTMLCVTENEVYKEVYVPFKRAEKSIPLNKITSVTTINLFWIFRSVIIFQYHHIPMIFFTWNNKEFKDKLDELINHETEDIENEYEDRNIITFVGKNFIKNFFIVLGCIILLIGIFRIFGVLFSPAKKAAGTYVNGESKIVLEKNGNCDIISLVETSSNCTWNINDEATAITISYDYKYDSWWGERTSSTSATLDYGDKKLTYNGVEYIK
jgi:hypothetical protein